MEQREALARVILDKVCQLLQSRYLSDMPKVRKVESDDNDHHTFDSLRLIFDENTELALYLTQAKKKVSA